MCRHRSRLPHRTVGYETMNEPSAGFIGAHAAELLEAQPLKMHESPTPFQAMALARWALAAPLGVSRASANQCGDRLPPPVVVQRVCAERGVLRPRVLRWHARVPAGDHRSQGHDRLPPGPQLHLEGARRVGCRQQRPARAAAAVLLPARRQRPAVQLSRRLLAAVRAQVHRKAARSASQRTPASAAAGMPRVCRRLMHPCDAFGGRWICRRSFS